MRTFQHSQSNFSLLFLEILRLDVSACAGVHHLHSATNNGIVLR